MDVRHRRIGETRGQPHRFIAALIDIDDSFQRRRRRRQRHRKTTETAARHRHITGVIDNAFFLFIGVVMFFIDNDETQFLKRQKQRRSRAHHQPRASIRHAPPAAPPLRARQVRMPRRRSRTKAFLNASQKRKRQRNFRKQDQRLRFRVFLQRRCDRFEINFGLAGPCDAIDQDRLVPALLNDGGERLRRKLLVVRKHGALVVKIGLRKWRVGINVHAGERARIGETAHHRFADIRLRRQIRSKAWASPGGGEHRLALRRHAQPFRGIGANKSRLHARALQRFGDPHDHPQERALGKHRVSRRPVDKGDQIRRERRRIEHASQRFQLFKRRGLPLGRPDNARNLPRTKGRRHERAQRRDVAIARIIIGFGQRHGEKHAHTLRFLRRRAVFMAVFRQGWSLIHLRRA